MQMKKFECASILLLAAALTAAAFPTPLSPKPNKDLTALEEKLHGSWKGQGGCTGEIVFRPNGTYARQHYGPVNQSSSGKWEVRWDALPPTLILKQDAADDDEEASVREFKIIKLDDSNFSYKSEDGSWTPTYKRSKD
jgi:hypothetical protein